MFNYDLFAEYFLSVDTKIFDNVFFIQVDLHEANKKLQAGAQKAGADTSQERKQLDDQRRQIDEQRKQLEERIRAIDQKSRSVEEKEKALQNLDQDLKKRKARMDQLEQQLQRVSLLHSSYRINISLISI